MVKLIDNWTQLKKMHCGQISFLMGAKLINPRRKIHNEL